MVLASAAVRLTALSLPLLLSLAGGALAQGGAALVGVDEVVRVPVAQTFPVLGRLVARNAGVVATRVGGSVAEVKVEVGDRVEAGDELVVLDRDRFRHERELRAADVAERRAELETMQQRRTMTSQELQRLERLRDTRSAAFRQALFDDKRVEIAMMDSELMEARARLQRAEASYRLVDIDFRDATITAPYPGVVALRQVSVGAYLRVGDPVATLVDDTDLEVEADVPADRIAGLRPGRVVEVAIGGKSYAAAVRAVVPQENPLTRTRAVRFTPDIPEPNGGLAANQSVTVKVPIGEARDVVSVHKDAVIDRQGRKIVFVVADGKATPRPVELGDAVGGRFEVTAGLEAGDLVVIRGNERLRPGQEVSYKDSAS